MGLLKLSRIDRRACLVGAALTCTLPWRASAQTAIKFSLDGRLEGLAAAFFLPQALGYFRVEGLEAPVDEPTNDLEPHTPLPPHPDDMRLTAIPPLTNYRDHH